jgi:Zn-dependent peptidase ImmA (M78 family)
MDKKKQAYTVIHELPHFSSHRREPSHAYPHALDDIQDDDDEMNRPVL